MSYPHPYLSLERPQTPSVMSMKRSFANYSPVQAYSPCHDTITRLSYPLTLHPQTTIQIYQNRGCTPMKALCRQCKTQTTISLTQQKLFLTAERLFLKSTDKVADIERNQKNTWAVNYQVGICEPFVEQNIGLKTLDNIFYPFADDFELELVVKLLQRIGEGLGERSLNLYLKMLKGMDEIVRAIPLAPVVQQHMSYASVPTFETPKKSGSVPPSSLIRPSTQHPPTAPGPPSSLAYPSQLPPLRQPPPTSNQLPPVSHILDRKPPLRSFNDLKELFELFDKIERLVCSSTVNGGVCRYYCQRSVH